MKQLSFIGTFIFALLLVLFIPQPVLAYVGPGAGIAAIGAFFAIVAGVIAALFGFLWYPIKRLLRKHKKSQSNKNTNKNTKEGQEA